MDLYQGSLPQGNEEPEMELSYEEYLEGKQQYQAAIDRGEAAKRLAQNPDFKALVTEGYFEEEPKRIAALMACGRLHPTSMDNCKNELFAIGHFREHMRGLTENIALAKANLESLEEAYEEALRIQREGTEGEA